MNIADRVHAAFVERTTTEHLIEILNEYSAHNKVMVLCDEKTTDIPSSFIVAWDDGSCNKFTFHETTVEIQTGEDMEFKPPGTILS